MCYCTHDTFVQLWPHTGSEKSPIHYCVFCILKLCWYQCIHRYICAYICIFVPIFAYVCIHLCICVSVCTFAYLCVHLCICGYICVCVHTYMCICVYICVFVRTPSPGAAPSVSLRPPMEFCRVPNTALVACTALYLFPTPSVGSTCFPVFSFHASSNLSHFFTVFPPTRCPLRGGGW